MSRKIVRTSGKPERVVYAEGATLPTVTANGFAARVNAYVIGQSGSCANQETDLWYLSLVGPHGQEAALRAIWATLVSTHPPRNAMDAPRLGDLGRVALAHARRDLLPSVLGWRIHWNWHLESVPPGRDRQAILEPDTLTCHDPGVLRDAPAMTVEELDAQKRHPAFLLLVRPEDQADPQRVPLLHLRFLAARIAPLASYPPFARYLWDRALAEGEVEPLSVWCYDATQAERDAHEQAQARSEDVERSSVTNAPALSPGPVLTAAYLCRPHPLELMRDLQRTVRLGLAARSDEALSLPPPTSPDHLPTGSLGGAVPLLEDQQDDTEPPGDTTPEPPSDQRVAAAEPTAAARPASPMLVVVREMVAAAGQSSPFESADEFQLTVSNPPWMDLVIEAHRLPRGRRQVTVTHYREQNGDLIPDPDIELDGRDGTPVALTIQGPDGPSYTHAAEQEETPARQRIAAELAAFADLWATNLRAQGFIQAAAQFAATIASDQPSDHSA